MINSIACFTVCNVAYLSKALTLAKSFKEWTGESIHIYLFDKRRNLPDFSDIALIYWMEELGIPHFDQLAFKYDITEFSTSLKPYLALRLFSSYEKVIFFDPDTFICSDISFIVNLLDVQDIVLTPHYITPQERGVELNQSDIGMMRFGSFNLGFFALSRSDESIRFLRWWDARCQDLCFFETQFGLSVDQKWISIAPCFFPSLHISFCLGLNVAFWNLHERRVTSETIDGRFLINELTELIFFHFSSFHSGNPFRLTSRPFGLDIKDEVLLQKLISNYSLVLSGYSDSLKECDLKYSYDYMDNGRYIAPTLRRAYASMIERFDQRSNPFVNGGEVERFAHRNALFDRRNAVYRPQSFGDIGAYSTVFGVTVFCLRFLLSILGPSRFMNLSRLFVYLSSYRQVEGLWKMPSKRDPKVTNLA